MRVVALVRSRAQPPQFCDPAAMSRARRGGRGAGCTPRGARIESRATSCSASAQRLNRPRLCAQGKRGARARSRAAAGLEALDTGVLRC